MYTLGSIKFTSALFAGVPRHKEMQWYKNSYSRHPQKFKIYHASMSYCVMTLKNRAGVQFVLSKDVHHETAQMLSLLFRGIATQFTEVWWTLIFLGDITMFSIIVLELQLAKLIHICPSSPSTHKFVTLIFIYIYHRTILLCIYLRTLSTGTTILLFSGSGKPNFQL